MYYISYPYIYIYPCPTDTPIHPLSVWPLSPIRVYTRADTDAFLSVIRA